MTTQQNQQKGTEIDAPKVTAGKFFKISSSYFVLISIDTSVDANDPPFGISIMTDPDLHPLPITPNDPLSIVSAYILEDL